MEQDGTCQSVQRMILHWAGTSQKAWIEMLSQLQHIMGPFSRAQPGSKLVLQILTYQNTHLSIVDTQRSTVLNIIISVLCKYMCKWFYQLEVCNVPNSCYGIAISFFTWTCQSTTSTWRGLVRGWDCKGLSFFGRTIVLNGQTPWTIQILFRCFDYRGI